MSSENPKPSRPGDRERHPEGDPEAVAHRLEDRDGQVDRTRGDDDALARAVAAEQRLARRRPSHPCRRSLVAYGRVLVEPAEPRGLEHGVGRGAVVRRLEQVALGVVDPDAAAVDVAVLGDQLRAPGACRSTASGNSGSSRRASAEALRSSLVSAMRAERAFSPAESEPDRMSIATTMTTMNSSVCQRRIEPLRRARHAPTAPSAGSRSRAR